MGGTKWIETAGRSKHRAEEMVEGLRDFAYVFGMPEKTLAEYLRKFRKQDWEKPAWVSPYEWHKIQVARRAPPPRWIKTGLVRGGPRGLAPGVLPQDKQGHYRATVAQLMQIYYAEGIDMLPSVRHL
jgi:hypothetical protein